MTDTHLKVSVFSSYQRLTIVLSSKSSHYLSFKKYILLVLQVSYSVLLIQLIFPFSLLGIEIYIPVWDFVLSYVLALMESKNPSRICTNSCLSPFKSLVQSCICCATKRTPSGTISYIIYIYIYIYLYSCTHASLCSWKTISPGKLHFPCACSSLSRRKKHQFSLKETKWGYWKHCNTFLYMAKYIMAKTYNGKTTVIFFYPKRYNACNL